MAAMTTYKGTARRDGRLWFVEVDGIGATQARNLADVEEMAVDLVAVVLEVDAADVTVDIAVELPREVKAELAKAEALRERAAQANSEAARHSRIAVRKLTGSGMTVRDAGRALGISYQRAHQLSKSE